MKIRIFFASNRLPKSVKLWNDWPNESLVHTWDLFNIPPKSPNALLMRVSWILRCKACSASCLLHNEPSSDRWKQGKPQATKVCHSNITQLGFVEAHYGLTSRAGDDTWTIQLMVISLIQHPKIRSLGFCLCPNFEDSTTSASSTGWSFAFWRVKRWGESGHAFGCVFIFLCMFADLGSRVI